jgi:hypothetical protein
MNKPNRKEFIVADEPESCEKCPKFKSCTKMCDRVNSWVSQDSVGRSSIVILENGTRDGMTLFDRGADMADWMGSGSTHIELTPSHDAWLKIKNMRLSEKIIRFIHSYYVMGKRIRDIAIEEKSTSQAIDRRHHHAKMCIKDRTKKMDRWPSILDVMRFASIQEYDMAILFYNYCYPRRIIARALSLNTSSVLKYISNNNKELKDKGV